MQGGVNNHYTTALPNATESWGGEMRQTSADCVAWNLVIAGGVLGIMTTISCIYTDFEQKCAKVN